MLDVECPIRVTHWQIYIFSQKEEKVILEELMDDDELREMIGKAPLLLETGKVMACHPCPTNFLEIKKKQTDLGV